MKRNEIQLPLMLANMMEAKHRKATNSFNCNEERKKSELLEKK